MYSEEEAKYDLEISLQNSKATLLIDDTDQNIIFARSLMGLDYYQNKVIYAARNETVLGSCSLVKVGVQPFTRPKIEAYLKQNKVELSHAKFLELLRACQGNPLYLYFFVNFQIDPLPDGLKAYQDALWRGFSLLQRELLGVIALSLFSPSLNLLHKAYNKLTEKNYSAMEIASVLNELSTIIQIVNGYYEIFHPYFKEAIANEVDRLGLSQSYHRVLGEINFASRRIVEATYHFRKAHDNRADNFLLEAAHYALLRGLWDIAEDFLNRQTEISRSKNDVWTEGYTCYHLSFLLRNKGLTKEAEIQIKHAIEAFKTCGDKNWEKFAKIQQYLDWILEGRGISAINAIKELLDVYEGVDPTGEAMILVNLSYAYIQVSQYEKGAEVAKRAYEIFATEGDFQGLTISLTNLTACLAQLDQHDLAKKYAEEITSLAEKLRQPRLKAAGLNHLALSLRESGDPASARRCLEEAIDICQRLGMIHHEIMNILNLGNTYKDQDDLINAEKCYQEGLAKAKECGLKEELGRALELIAILKRRKGDYQEAIDFATKAIEIQKETGNSLRIAESLIKRAAAFVALNKNRKAAQDYEEAGNNYRTVSKCIDSITSYERASCQWAIFGDEKKSLESLEKAIEYSFQGDKIDVAMSSIEVLQKTKKIVGLDIFYLSVIEQYVKASSKANLAISFYSFASYCKLSNTKEAKNSYVKALKILAGQASKHRNICNTLIAGIEQADEKLLTNVEFELIANCLVENMDGFYYRKMPEGITIWTTVLQLNQPIIFQIQCFSERLTEKRLSLILMLAVLANKETLCQNIKDLSGFKGNSVTFIMLGQEEFEVKIQKLPEGILIDERPAVITQSGVPFTEEQPSIPIIIHKNYSVIADWSIYPENKAIIWLLMNFHRSIIENITQRRDEEIGGILAKKAREFCEEIFGYKEIEKSESDNAQVRWQIENIKSLIEKFQKMGKNERR